MLPSIRAVLAVATLVVVGCNGGGSGGSGGSGADGGAGAGAGSNTSGGTGTSGSSGQPTPGGTTFGPDLAQALAPPATANTFGCGAGFPVQTNGSFPQPFLGAGASSCLVLTFIANPTQVLPPSGTAVSATIFVPGTTTGRMRFVRMRILFQNAAPGQPPATPKCCSVEQYGTEFTPAAGTTTTVPLGFPMVFDSVPAANDSTTIAKNDLLGLEVLDPTTPIPGFWKTNGGPDVGVTASFMWLPALSARGVQAPSAELILHEGSYSGFVPYFNFVLAPN